MLQCEFEGKYPQNSVRRTTALEEAAGNFLDARFTIIIDGRYSDLDVKGPVSQETSDYQAKVSLKSKRAMTIYEQGTSMGKKIIQQKSKHCNPHLAELPSSPRNVEHVVNLIELSVNEKSSFLIGLNDGLKEQLAKDLNLVQFSISDRTARDGVAIINEDFTIKRID